MSEAEKLDALTLEEAKGILLNMGYFRDDIVFLSCRFDPGVFDIVQRAFSHYNLQHETVIAGWAEQELWDRGETP